MIALAVSALVTAATGHGVVPPLDASVVERVRDATVLVDTRYGLGSGFVALANEGRMFVVTNHHVVTPPRGKQPGRIEVQLGAGPRRWPLAAQVVAVDAATDLALLSVPQPEGAPAPLHVARSCDRLGGRPVYAAGHPYGATVNLSPGRVSPDVKTPGLLVLDLGLNPGNSGGPVVTADGVVIGVAVANVRRSERSYAVPCTAIQRLFAGSASFDASLRDVSPRVGAPEAAPPAAAGSDAGTELGEGLALLVGSGGRGTGLLVSRRGDELLFVTADVDMFRVRIGDRVSARLRGDTTARRARLLRLEETVALVAVPVAGTRMRPFTISPRLPRETEQVRVLGFDPFALVDDFKVVLEPGNVTAIRGLEFQVDTGVDGAILGGPVVDAEGKIIGAARRRRPGNNVSLAVPGTTIRAVVEHECVDAFRSFERVPRSAAPQVTARYDRGLALVDARAGAEGEGVRLLSAACTEGHALSCRMAGVAYLGGVGVSRDVERGEALVRKACAMGSGQTCREIWMAWQECPE